MRTSTIKKLVENKLSGFSESCYDQNDIASLQVALTGQADRVDMKTWNITAKQWRSEIRIALAHLLNDRK